MVTRSLAIIPTAMRVRPAVTAESAAPPRQTPSPNTPPTPGGGGASGDVTLTRGAGLAQIGNSAASASGSPSTAIAVLAGGSVTLNNAQIGNSAGSTGGTVLVTSLGNLTLASGASIRASGSGDAL